MLKPTGTQAKTENVTGTVMSGREIEVVVVQDGKPAILALTETEARNLMKVLEDLM